MNLENVNFDINLVNEVANSVNQNTLGDSVPINQENNFINVPNDLNLENVNFDNNQINLINTEISFDENKPSTSKFGLDKEIEFQF